MGMVQMEARSVAICVQGPWGDMRWPTSLSLPIILFGTETDVPTGSLQTVLKIQDSVMDT